jgi:hypothetical protein
MSQIVTILKQMQRVPSITMIPYSGFIQTQTLHSVTNIIKNKRYKFILLESVIKHIFKLDLF